MWNISSDRRSVVLNRSTQGKVFFSLGLRTEEERLAGSFFRVMLRLIRRRADLFWFGQAKLALKVKTVAGESAY